MQRFIIPIVFIALMLAAAWFKAIPFVPAQNPDPNHTHADFAVWVDNQKLDFNQPQWMSGESTDPDHDHEEGLRKYLHLHDNVGTVIHRHKPGLTLKDFFDSLQVGFDTSCYISFEPLADGQICSEHPFRMFVNGEEMPFDLLYAFEDSDQILLTTAADDAAVQRQLKDLSNDACRYSQTCPWRGKPPAENCVADPAVPCTE